MAAAVVPDAEERQARHLKAIRNDNRDTEGAAMPSSSRPHSLPSARLLAAGLLCCLITAGAGAVELETRTLRAYEAYLDEARRLFLEHVPADGFRWRQDEAAARTPQLKSGAIVGDPGREDGIVEVPGGLVHHWIGVAFIPGVTLDRALELSKAYSDYPTIYKSVKVSRVLGRDGETFRMLFRFAEDAGVVSATFDLWSTVRYVRVGRTRAYSVATATEIREVENAGEPNERLLAAGKDRGYLWQASSFTKLVERDGGVYVELETLGLSRGFPAMLGWIIEPVARRLGRKSVEGSLREFRGALTSP